jgi:hypothetical protein
MADVGIVLSKGAETKNMLGCFSVVTAVSPFPPQVHGHSRLENEDDTKYI